MLTERLLKTLFSLSLAFLLTAVSYVCTVQAQDADSLVLNVTVTNQKGELSRGLTMENFSITADKQAQKILSLSDDDMPASIGILIDDSASQDGGDPKANQDFRDQLRQALEQFLKLSHASNEYFVVTFNSKVHLVQDWTSDAGAVVEKLDSLKFKHLTTMYDALKFGAEKVKTGHNAKHVLILVSDGIDNNSKASFKDVRDLLKASDVLLYCVGINNVLVGDPGVPIPYVDGLSVLSEFSANSGGRSLFMTNASGPKAFMEVFELIALELRTQYQLVIAPDHAGGKTKWRKIKLDAKRSPERLMARTRLWFYR